MIAEKEEEKKGNTSTFPFLDMAQFTGPTSHYHARHVIAPILNSQKLNSSLVGRT